MIPILVERHSASSTSLDVRMIADVLSSLILMTTDCMKRRASGSIPADGSSRIMMGGLPTNAIPTDSFLLLPPLNAPDYFFL